MGQLGAMGRPRRRSHWLLPTLRAVQVSPSISLFLTHSSNTNTITSCLTARRRRKAGRQPFYGTGWAARPGQGGATNAQPYYNNNYNQQPAPPYSTEPNNSGYYGGGGANQGYYNNQQQNGVELQSPQPAYGGQGGYQPPPGPPPGKGDGIVR